MVSGGAGGACCGAIGIGARNARQAVWKSVAVLIVSVGALDAGAVARLRLEQASCTFDASRDVRCLIKEGECSGEANGAYLRSLAAVLTGETPDAILEVVVLLLILRIIGDKGVDRTVDAACGAVLLNIATCGTHVAENAGR